MDFLFLNSKKEEMKDEKIKLPIKRNCEHFDNNVQYYFECCDEYFDCSKCHTELKKNICEKVKMNKINYLRCTECTTVHDLNKDNLINCKSCKIQFAKYHCGKCRHWLSNYDKLYHCDFCKTCKYGRKDDNIHCHTCNRCYSIEYYKRHKCNANINTTCLICLEDLIMIN